MSRYPGVREREAGGDELCYMCLRRPNNLVTAGRYDRMNSAFVVTTQ